MATDSSKQVVRDFIEQLWNQGNLDHADRYLHPNFEEHSAGPEPSKKGKGDGLEGYKDFVRMFRGAFPDIHFSIEQMIAEGDNVAVHLKGTGTHKGPLMGLAPTGKHITINGAAIHRIEDGRIVETYEFVDKMGLRQQLGAPEMGAMTA